MSNIKKLKHPYGYVANTIINDKTLSYNAKGIYLYILSKPDQWDFSHRRIAGDSITSEYSVRKAIKELENSNLLNRIKLGNGRVIYEIKDPVQECVTQKTNTTSGLKSQKMNTQVADSQVAKTGGISNKDIKVIKSISNKDSKAVALQGKQWNELIDGFKEINPLYEEFYKNTTERKALDFLVSKLGFEKVKNTIAHLPEITSQKYAPKITKPSELKRDLGKLIIFYKQSQINQTKYGGQKVY